MPQRKSKAQIGCLGAAADLRDALKEHGIAEIVDVHFSCIDLPKEELAAIAEEMARHYFPGDVSRLPESASVHYSFGPLTAIATQQRMPDPESARARLVATGGASVTVYAKSAPLLSFVMPKELPSSAGIDRFERYAWANGNEVRLRLEYQQKVCALLENSFRDIVQVRSDLVPGGLIRSFLDGNDSLPYVIKQLHDTVAAALRTHPTLAVERRLDDTYALRATATDSNGRRQFGLYALSSGSLILSFEKRPGKERSPFE